jgi:hypothetical protein
VRKAVYVAYVDPTSAHRVLWRDRREQMRTHWEVGRDLFPEVYTDAWLQRAERRLPRARRQRIRQ